MVALAAGLRRTMAGAVTMTPPPLPTMVTTRRWTLVPVLRTAKRWASSSPEAAQSPSTSSPSSPLQASGDEQERILILGSGWAGYAVARTISPSVASRILISPRSHFVFTPLLASTSVGTLEFRSAIEPVRRLGLTEFHQAWASDIDFQRKRVRVEATMAVDGPSAAKGVEFDVPYDKLVLAVGCYSQTFGIEGVKEHACFLRDVGDARRIRLRVLELFELADLPTTSEEERKKLLHFAIVGGGPTGIEFAAELHDLIHDDLAKMYPRLIPHVTITVYDIAPKVLPMFDQSLASYATDLFRRQGIQVKTEHRLQRIRRHGDGLLLKIQEEPEEVPAGIVVWSTGLMQNPLVSRLVDKEIDGIGRLAKDARTGGLVTDGYMRVQLQAAPTQTDNVPDSDKSASSSVEAEPGTKTLPDVYAVGDCAVVQGQSYPATAQVASQQAVYLARRLNKGTAAEDNGRPFKFRNLGAMAYLGSWRAIHQSGKDELRGRVAWILWRTAYLTKSMSIRNKVMIPVYWLVTWIFGRDISRF